MPVFAAITDIHANLDALEAVIADLGSEGKKPDAVWFLGDLLDPGPHPARVYYVMKHLLNKPESVWLAGNHDKALQWVVTKDQENPSCEKRCFDSLADFYRESVIVCSLAVSKEQIADVANHPTQLLRNASNGLPSIFFAHGFPSIDDCDACMKYDTQLAPANHSEKILKIKQEKTPDTQIWIVGHSHRQAAWFFNGTEWRDLVSGFGTDLNGTLRSRYISGKKPEVLGEANIDFSTESPESLLILNPGSVGFPRDGIHIEELNIAKYLLIDLNGSQVKVRFCAVPYYFSEESRKIWQKWYPPSILQLISRNIENANEENGQL